MTTDLTPPGMTPDLEAMIADYHALRSGTNLRPSPLARPNVVGLWSPAPQSGKSTSRAALAGAAASRGRPARPVSFATPLRSTILALTASLGVPPEVAMAHSTRGDLKEVPIPGVGKSFVELAIKLGTEVGRQWIGEDVWVDAWAAKTDGFLRDVRPTPLILTDDVRFPNELAAIRARGGVLIGVIRPGADVSAQRAAAEGRVVQNDMDTVVINDGDVEQLAVRVTEAARRLGVDV